MHCKTVTILLWIRVRGHFVVSITRNHVICQSIGQPSISDGLYYLISFIPAGPNTIPLTNTLKPAFPESVFIANEPAEGRREADEAAAL